MLKQCKKWKSLHRRLSQTHVATWMPLQITGRRSWRPMQESIWKPKIRPFVKFYTLENFNPKLFTRLERQPPCKSCCKSVRRGLSPTLWLYYIGYMDLHTYIKIYKAPKSWIKQIWGTGAGWLDGKSGLKEVRL